MQTKVKSNSVITHKLTPAGICFTVLGAGEFTFDPKLASESNRQRAELHGWIQRISDKAAIGSSDAEGKTIPAAIKSKMKFEAMKACAEHYMQGSDQWNMVADGEPLPTNLTVRALASVLGVSHARGLEMVVAQAKAQGKTTQKLLAEYRLNPGKVRDAYDALVAAERVVEGSSEDMLAELMASVTE